MTRFKSSDQVVYFVRAKTMGLVKIGITSDLSYRLKNLQVGSPDTLELVGVIMDRDAEGLERSLHRQFASDRSHGEWFRSSAALEALIAANPRSAYDRHMDRLLRAAIEDEAA